MTHTTVAQGKSLNGRIWEKHSFLKKPRIYSLISIDYKKHFLPKRDLIDIIEVIKNVCTSSIFPKSLSASS